MERDKTALDRKFETDLLKNKLKNAFDNAHKKNMKHGLILHVTL